MTEIGQLNRRVSFLKRVAGTDGAGQPIDSWVLAFKLWASIAGKSGLKTITGAPEGVSSSVTQYSIRVRKTNAITVDMRGECDGVEYRIISIQQDNVELKWTDLVCQVGAAGA